MTHRYTILFSTIGILTLILLTPTNWTQAQQGPSTTGGDALWHLPKFGENGWFLHAHNGRVRVCNMDQASVVGNRPGPKCSEWE